MQVNKKNIAFLLIIASINCGCYSKKQRLSFVQKRPYTVSKADHFSISPSQSVWIDYPPLSALQKADSNTSPDILIPFRKAIDSIMALNIGTSQDELKKDRPNGTLGNMVADAILWKMQQGYKADVAVVNYGGIRIPSLAAGNISLGKVYEIMPFDNLISVLSMTGEELATLCNKIAASGGWPIAGISFTIQDNTAADIKIEGKAIVKDSIYRVAMSDYIANGGDKCDFLKSIKQEKSNILMRDAIVDFIKFCDIKKQNISQLPTKRIL